MFHIFETIPNLRYGMSTRADGSMLLPERSGTQETQQNRDLFFRKQGIDPSSVVTPLLAHGSSVAIVTERDRGKIVRDVDGLITDRSNVVLTVTAADCLPVFLFDPLTLTIGLVHAGRKGLAANVLTAAIDRMEQTFDVNPLDLLVAIGPGIGPCHYDVSIENARPFSRYPEAASQRDGRIFLDLRAVVQQQCLALAVRLEHIEVSPVCTYENDQLFSARRDQTQPIEAMVAYCSLA